MSPATASPSAMSALQVLAVAVALAFWLSFTDAIRSMTSARPGVAVLHGLPTSAPDGAGDPGHWPLRRPSRTPSGQMLIILEKNVRDFTRFTYRLRQASARPLRRRRPHPPDPPYCSCRDLTRALLLHRSCDPNSAAPRPTNDSSSSACPRTRHRILPRLLCRRNLCLPPVRHGVVAEQDGTTVT